MYILSIVFTVFSLFATAMIPIQIVYSPLSVSMMNLVCIAGLVCCGSALISMVMAVYNENAVCSEI